MPSHRPLAATVLAAALATLTACSSGGTTGSAPAGPTAPSATATAAAVRSGEPTAAPGGSAGGPPAGSPGGSPWGTAEPTRDLPLDPEPSFDCPTGDLPAGHRAVLVTAAPSGGVFQARAARLACDPDGGGLEPTGPAVRYRLAADATAELNAGAGAFRTVSLAELSRHITACLGTAGVKPPFSCSGGFYEITVTGSGRVSDLREVWHP